MEKAQEAGGWCFSAAGSFVQTHTTNLARFCQAIVATFAFIPGNSQCARMGRAAVCNH
jgi:hypothetical protein